MITLDKETKSYADLPKVGAWAYSEDLTTDVICSCWGIDDQPIQEWWPEQYHKHGEPQGDTDELFYAIRHGELIEAHNVAFERSIWQNIMGPHYGWPLPKPEQWRDTMAVACYYALPAKLEKLAHVLGFQGKDPEGGRLITKYSKLYLKTAKKDIPKNDFLKFVEYCKQDVRIEQSVSDFLGDLPKRELEAFLADQRMNMRGLYLDIEGIEAATRVMDQRSEQLRREFRKITGLNPTQRDKVMGWFEDNGLKLDNMQADYLEDLLENPPMEGSPVGDLGQGELRRAIEIRLAINKASTKKLDAMSRQRGKDKRARFQVRYHGALTGRPTGSGFQPLNLNRGYEDVEPEQLVRDIMYEDARWLDSIYGSATDAIAKASRHWIMAEPGNRILAGDFVSIEAVILACLAGEEWKIEAFKQGVKIYEHMADKIYNFDPGTVTKETHPQERQDGKTGELAFGYQGALGAWLKFDNSGRHSDERIIEICKSWRKEHPSIVKFWYGLQDAAIEAVLSDKETSYRQIGFEVVDEWLTMILPNGKRLWYWKPEIRAARSRWCKPAEYKDCAEGLCDHEPVPQLSYMAQKEGQWKRVKTYGGKLCLAGDTKVLTYRGWLTIVDLRADDLLWDGEAWVGHSGVIHQGQKFVIDLAGVKMTPDHLILTTEGWVDASQSEGYYRAKSRLPHSPRICWQRRPEIPVASGMYMRQISNDTRIRVTEAIKARDNCFMRMYEKENNFTEANEAWYVAPPGILCLAFDAGSMPFVYPPSLAQLWGQGYQSLQTMANIFREFLGRHGANLQERFNSGKNRQQWRLHPPKLPMGYAISTGKQHPKNSFYKHPQGPYVDISSSKSLQPKKDHSRLQAPARVAGKQSVYDIANAGPRQRFVVRDKDGLPLIVHNCENACQATSREILLPATLRAEEAGYPIILTVYDEIVAEVPEDFGSKEEFEQLMAGPLPDFAKGWPVRAEAWEGLRYKK